MPRPHKSTQTTALVPAKATYDASVIVHSPPLTLPIKKVDSRRSLTKSLLPFCAAMIKHHRMVLSGAIAGLVGLGFSIAEKNMSARVAVCMSVAFVTIAVFNAWRDEHNKRLDAEDRIALLKAETASLKAPSATVEIRSARLEVNKGISLGHNASQSVLIWRLYLDVYVCPPIGQTTSFPLHRCNVIVRTTVAGGELRPDGADFTLIMALENAHKDIHTMAVAEAGMIRCLAQAHTQDSADFNPPQTLTAMLDLQDSYGRRFDTLHAHMERRLIPGHKMLWETAPTL